MHDDSPFFCSKIIDNRIYKDRLGVVHKGLGNRKVDATFRDGLEPYLKKIFTRIFPVDENKEELVFIVQEFNIWKNLSKLA